jgi:hypothetical protein
VRIESAAPWALETWYPTEEALDRLSTVDIRQRGGMTLLLALLDTGRRDARDEVRAVAWNDPRWDGWTTVLNRLVQDLGAGELAEDILHGVRANPADESRLILLVDVVRAAPRAPGPRAFARSLLADPVRDSPQLGRLAAELIRRSPGTQDAPVDWLGRKADQDAAMDWLGRRVRQENGPALVAAFAPDSPMSLMDYANRWLERYPEDPEAGELFARQLGWHKLANDRFYRALRQHLDSLQPGTGSPVVARITAMLAASPDQASWTYLFAVLPETERTTPEVQAIARDWLTGQPDSRGWSGVFSLLADAVPGEDADLFALALEWLPRAGDHWPHVMRAALGVCPEQERDAQVARAIDWLAANMASEFGWAFLSHTVLRLSTPDQEDELIGLALTWLRDHFGATEWSYVWRAAVGTRRERDKLVELADEWLRTKETGWRHVFLEFWQVSDDPGRPPELALPWLRDHVGDADWPAVFGLVAARLTREQTVELFAYWLENVRKSDSAMGYLWKVLVEDDLFPGLSAEPALRAGVLRWLRVHPRARSWWHIWSATQIADPTSRAVLDVAVTARVTRERAFGLGNRVDQSARQNPEVRAAAVGALADNAPGPGWPVVWLGLVGAEMTPELWRLGLRYLDDEAAESFSLIWKRLWDAEGADRAALEDIGVTWCEKNQEHLSFGSVWLRLADNPESPRRETIHVLGASWLANPASGKSKRRDEVAAALTPS